MPNKERLEAAQEWVAERTHYHYFGKDCDRCLARHLALLEYMIEVEERRERKDDDADDSDLDWQTRY